MKILSSIPIILAFATILSVQGMSIKSLGRSFVNTMVLSNRSSVTWEVYPDDLLVEFEVTAESTGWVGFGFSDQANMFQGDLVMGGWNAETGESYFSDRHSGGPGRPAVDDSQDYDLISATEEAGVTTLRFVRPFDTGDVKDDMVFEDRITWFIWALGPNDDTTQYHIGDRGNAEVNILHDQNSD